jgi:hypothetical protein
MGVNVGAHPLRCEPAGAVPVPAPLHQKAGWRFNVLGVRTPTSGPSSPSELQAMCGLTRNCLRSSSIDFLGF